MSKITLKGDKLHPMFVTKETAEEVSKLMDLKSDKTLYLNHSLGKRRIEISQISDVDINNDNDYSASLNQNKSNSDYSVKYESPFESWTNSDVKKERLLSPEEKTKNKINYAKLIWKTFRTDDFNYSDYEERALSFFRKNKLRTLLPVDVVVGKITKQKFTLFEESLLHIISKQLANDKGFY